MSFEPQNTEYSCGPAALRYALSLLGIGLRGTEELTEEDVRAVIGKRWQHAASSGYDERELGRGARRLGLTGRARAWRDNPSQCLDALATATARGHVCVVSVHDEGTPHFHWMCVAGFDGPGRAVVLDPSTYDSRLSPSTYRVLDPAGQRVPALMASSRLKTWLTPSAPQEEGQFFLELWADSPRFPASFRWHEGLTRTMARHAAFAQRYDEYVDEVRSVFGATGGRDAADFIEDARDGLLRDAALWMAVEGRVASRFVNQEVDAWAAIARAYQLRVKAGDARRALTSLGYLLGWRAAELMYEVGRSAA
jgi:hypothetical protein